MSVDPSQFDSQTVIKLERLGIAGDNLTGFLLGYSANLMMVHQFHDFVDFGISIVRAQDVTSLRSGEDERMYNEILLTSGFDSAVPSSHEIPLQNWETCFEFLAERDYFVSLETERGDSEEDEVFTVGIPSEVVEDTLWVLSCSAYGQWETEEIATKISDITRVQLENPYLKALFRFAASRQDSGDQD